MINSRLYHRLMRCEDRSLFSLFLFISIVPGTIFSAELETYASYHIAVDDKLIEMHVQLCFFQQVPDALTTGSRIAHRALKNLRIEGNLVPARDKSRGIIYLKALSPRQCLYYDVDLSIAMTEGRVTRFGQPGQADILLRVSSWLWLPDVDTRDRRITLTFELAKGMSISVPWRPIQNNNDYFSFALIQPVPLFCRFLKAQAPAVRVTPRRGVRPRVSDHRLSRQSHQSCGPSPPPYLQSIDFARFMLPG